MGDQNKTYTAQEAIALLGEALSKSMDTTPKSYTAQEAAEELRKSVQDRVDAFADQLVLMREAELRKSVPGESPVLGALSVARQGVDLARVGVNNPDTAVQTGLDKLTAATKKKPNHPAMPATPATQKPVAPINKAEDFIDLKNSADTEKRTKTLFKQGKLPSDEEIEKFVNDGCGTLDKPKKLQKDMLSPGKTQASAAMGAPKAAAPKTPAVPKMGAGGGSAQPAGVPAAPKAPKAPGAAFGKAEIGTGKFGSLQEFDDSPSPFESSPTAGFSKYMPPAGRTELPFNPSPDTGAPMISRVAAEQMDPAFQAGAPALGPTARAYPVIRKSEVGDCVLCKKAEHAGPCK